MYMEPIVAARPLPSLAQRRVVGTLLVVSGLLAMVPWLALCGLCAGIGFGARALLAAPRTLKEAIDHAGDYAHGL